MERWLLCMLAGCVARAPAEAPTPRIADDRPNLLLIVADDLGYADLGSFGSDIATPHLDTLAERGVRATRFHTAPMCAPTRSMLLTGNNNHVAGMGFQTPSPFQQRHLRGYEGHLPDRVAPLPRLLRDAGYRTYMVGKWHLGVEAEHSPRSAGFERSFGLVHGAASHYDATGFFEGGSVYREDGERVGWPDGAYATELYTDRLIAYLDEPDDGRPFFAFAAYTAPHWPLQVPGGERDRYAGAYDDGYDVLRERNFAALQDAGIVAADRGLPPRNPDVPQWTSLSPAERRVEAREMELYAAMVSNLDHHVGRLVAHLEAKGILDRTLIVFLSDNGAAGEDFYVQPPFRDYVQAHYDNALASMGSAASWVSYGRAWAEAGSAPFRGIKASARQGGIVAPMITAGPGVARRGAIDGQYLTVMDIAPTLLEVAGVPYPEGFAPMRGESLVPALAGDTPVHTGEYVTTLFHRGHGFVRQGPYKLVDEGPDFAEAEMELFDVVADPGETYDLSDTEPALRDRLLQLWRTERRELGIVLPRDL
ncbi:MAG: arylsulfatase [Myxococcota bacterium]